MFSHILLEVYCLFDIDENKDKAEPDFCPSCDHKPRYGCLLNRCPFVSFTSCENTLCYADESSVAENAVSLGENYTAEQISLWERIAGEKIDEAYDEFLKRTGRN